MSASATVQAGAVPGPAKNQAVAQRLGRRRHRVNLLVKVLCVAATVIGLLLGTVTAAHRHHLKTIFGNPQHDPIPVETQIAVLWMVQNGYMDGVPEDRIKEYQRRFTEFLTTSKASLIELIGRKKVLDEALITDLKAAAEQFTQLWT